MVAFGVLLGFAALGLILRRNDALGRMAASLTILFPALMIGLSSITSLLVPRYFIPAIPGIALAVVGFFSASLLSARSIALTTVIMVVSALALVNGPFRARTFASETQQQMALLQNLGVKQLHGATAYPHMRSPLEYYIRTKLHVTPILDTIRQPLTAKDLENDEIYWIFDPKNGEGKKLITDVKTLCHFSLKNTDVYIVAGSLVTPSFACPSASD
jgi:hypothetical protein